VAKDALALEATKASNTNQYKPLRMGNAQVRLPEDLQAEVNGLAARMHGSQSDAIRVALAEGIRAIRQREALQSYIEGRCSLARAAKDAGTSLHEMAARAASLNVPYARYPADEAEGDLGDLR
jgi:hypothetical protein